MPRAHHGRPSEEDFWHSHRENAYLTKRFDEIRPFGVTKTCLDLKNALAWNLIDWAHDHPETAILESIQPEGIASVMNTFRDQNWLNNMYAANALRNHTQALEGRARHTFGSPDGSDFGEGVGVWQFIRTIFVPETWERGFLGDAGGGSLSAATAAEDLTKLMRLAPEIKGRILFYLIAVFPLFLLLGRHDRGFRSSALLDRDLLLPLHVGTLVEPQQQHSHGSIPFRRGALRHC